MTFNSLIRKVKAMNNPKRETGKPNGQKPTPVVRPNHRPYAVVRWSDIPDDTIAGLVHLVASNGGAIMFGCTSDGGAYSLCVLDGDNKIKEYPHTADEVLSVYQWLKDEYYGG